MRTDPVNTVRIFRTMPPSARWGQNTAYAEVAFCAEETAVEGLVAGAPDRRDEPFAIVRFQRTNFDPASIAQRFNRRILGCS
jgi:hypothetical protein